MQAIKLSKKYPEFKQEEIFDLINKFQYVPIVPITSIAISGVRRRPRQLALTLQTDRCRR